MCSLHMESRAFTHGCGRFTNERESSVAALMSAAFNQNGPRTTPRHMACSCVEVDAFSFFLFNTNKCLQQADLFLLMCEAMSPAHVGVQSRAGGAVSGIQHGDTQLDSLRKRHSNREKTLRHVRKRWMTLNISEKHLIKMMYQMQITPNEGDHNFR